MEPVILKEILLFVAFSIPLMLFVAKIFAVREKVYSQLQSLEHRCSVQDERLQYLEDKSDLGLNGLRELVEHKAARFITTSERSIVRIEDIEEFLAKTTQFSKRGQR